MNDREKQDFVQGDPERGCGGRRRWDAGCGVWGDRQQGVAVSESEEQGQDQAGHPVRDVRTGKFQAGVSGNKSGRPKGAPSLASTKNAHLRDQIIEAARLAGMGIDPSSPDGVTAYLYSIAMSDKKAMSSLLARVLPIMPTRVALPPIEKAADLVGANSALLKAAADGEISTSDAVLYRDALPLWRPLCLRSRANLP